MTGISSLLGFVARLAVACLAPLVLLAISILGPMAEIRWPCFT